jgi:hypothetical protein
MNPFDHVIMLRREKLFTVVPVSSMNNEFRRIAIPQHPWMADNDFNSPHCDSYCSASVSLSGPVTETLKLIQQFNPYGTTACMVCNRNNQVIDVSMQEETMQFWLIVFDEDCRIIAATPTGKANRHSFGGGYFYLDNNDNTIVVQDGRIACYPTNDVPKSSDEVKPLDPLWVSDNIVERVTGSPLNYALYSVLPVWDSDRPDHYWYLLAGSYQPDSNEFVSPAYIAVAKVVPNDGAGEPVTTIVDALGLTSAWNNNTFAVDQTGAYIVTNTYNPSTRKRDEGRLYCFTFDLDDRIHVR